MSEAMAPPLRDLPLAGRILAVSGGRLTIRPAPPTSRHVLRCRREDAERVGNALALALPREACRSHANGSKAALWLGPDEWLLIADRAEGWPRVEGVAMSLVDVSHRSVALELEGEDAEDVLASACPLDLHRAMFAPGSCARTLFGKCEIVLWRTTIDRFWLDVGRSHADYVWRLLEIACTDTADMWSMRRPAR